MFDTMQIAQRIKSARIEKNMTQLQLADVMGVSYQAVSNWERGNSMPDISKLGDLCDALDLTVNELLGVEEKTASAVTKAMDKEALTVEELKEVAPMLPPEQVREHTEKETQGKKVDFFQIVHLAPFLDMEYLGRLVESAAPKDLAEIVCIAPFLDTECLRRVVQKCENNGDFGTIMRLAPFLDQETLDEMAEKLVAEDLSQMISLAPFLSKESLDKLVSRSNVDMDCALLCGLAPFVSEQTLDLLVEQMIEEGMELDCIGGLAPFLSKATLRKVADKLMGNRDLDGFNNINVFL